MSGSLVESLRNTVRLNFASSPEQMEASLLACVDEWAAHHLPARDNAPLLAAAAEAVRIADGRPSWSSDNLPGADIARARAVLAVCDRWLGML